MSGQKTLVQRWMLYNPGICYIQKCLLQSKGDNEYYCRIHKLLHKCDYVHDERWGPDLATQRYNGYTCPLDMDEESGEIRCAMTGHLLQAGQPEYIGYTPNTENILYGGEDACLNSQNNDQVLSRLFMNYDLQALVQMFAPMHNGVLSANQQETMMSMLSHRVQQSGKLFKSETKHYYYKGIYEVAKLYGGCLWSDPEADKKIKGNKYRAYIEWIAAVKLVWRCLMPYHQLEKKVTEEAQLKNMQERS